MNNHKIIKIAYKYYIPETWIQEFEKEFVSTDYKIIKSKDNERLSYATGTESFDIILYIRENPESILFGSLIAPAIYDIIKSGLLMLCRKLKKLKARKHIKDKEIKIFLKFQNIDGSRVEIEISENIEGEIIRQDIAKSYKMIQADKIEKIFNNPDYVYHENKKPRIRLKYNFKTQQWEPVNFGVNRRRMEEIIRKAQQEFHN